MFMQMRRGEKLSPKEVNSVDQQKTMTLFTYVIRCIRISEASILLILWTK